ncbi:unnamed protein product [Vicia faba]|uniref:Uncharacterized protein n=1 Tax=Vicia faba TaxID=3906 RepID=A0AAV0YXX3_VICFA|nr:unnamed protein product [Vicia faba]
MSRPPIAICDLMPEHNVWKLAIHIVDLGIIKEQNGGQIHVVTRSRELEIWNTLLKKNETYMIYNGEPLINNFSLKSFQDFLKGDFVVDYLYDIIGVVQNVARTQVPGAGKKTCVNLSLTDESGNELDFTLWETYASQFMTYSSDIDAPIIILTYAWCHQSSSNL